MSVPGPQRVNLRRSGAKPPAHGVDEVTAFAGEPRTLERLVAVPALRPKSPGVDGVPGNAAACRAAEPGPHLDEHRREAPVESDHETVVARRGDDVQHPGQLLGGECQGFLDEYGLAGFEGAAGQVDRKSTRLNSSHLGISYAVFCLD